MAQVCHRKEIEKNTKRIDEAVEAISSNDFTKLKDLQTRIKYNVDNLEIATPDEWAKYVDDVYKGNDYKNAQNIIHMADFSDEIIKQLKLPTNRAFVDKKQLSHIRAARKGTQALRDEEVLEIPNIIANAKKALTDDSHTGFSVGFRDVLNDEKINFLHFDYDEIGNLMLSAQKVDRKDIAKRFKNFNQKAEVGAAPTISASKIDATTTNLDTSAAKMNDSQKELKKQEILNNLNNQSEMFVNDSFTNNANAWERWVDRQFNGGEIKEKIANVAKKMSIDDDKVEEILKTKNHPLKVLADNLSYNYRMMDNNIELDARNTYELLNKYDKKDIESVFDALNGTADKNALKEHLKPLYEKVRDTIDKNANELVELGVLKEEHKITDYVKRYYAKYLDENANIVTRIKALGLKKGFKRKELSEKEINELGLQKNAFAIINTIKEQRLQIEKAKRLKELADKYSADEPLGDDWVKMSDKSDGGVKEFGALNGRYVPKELKDMIDDLGQIAATKGFLEKYWVPIISHLKVNLTAKNPATHLYNFFSNYSLSFFKGDFAAVNKLMTTEHKDYKAWEHIAQRYGLSIQGEMVDASMKKLAQKDKGNALTNLAKNIYMAEGSKAGDAIRNLYNLEDAIFKVAHFKKLMESKGFDIKKAFNNGKIDYEYLKGFDAILTDAMKRANYEYVDYGTKWSKGFRFLDQNGVMPFFQYAYKSTPMVARSILKNPIKYSLYLGAMSGAGGLSLINNDEKNTLKPDWAKNGVLPNLFLTDSWIKLGSSGMYFNAGRAMPGFRFDGFDGFKLMGGGFVESAMRIFNGETSLGYKYINKDDSKIEQNFDRLVELSKNFLPPLTLGRYAQNYAKLGINALFDEKNKPFKVIQDSNKQDLDFFKVSARMAGARELGEKRNAQTALNENTRLLRKAIASGDKAKAKELQAKGKEIIRIAKEHGYTLKVPKGKIPKNTEGKGLFGAIKAQLSE